MQIFISDLLAQLVELPVLGQEGEPVRDHHGLSQVVQQVRGPEFAGVAVFAQQLVCQEGGETDVLRIGTF